EISKTTFSYFTSRGIPWSRLTFYFLFPRFGFSYRRAHGSPRTRPVREDGLLWKVFSKRPNGSPSERLLNSNPCNTAEATTFSVASWTQYAPPLALSSWIDFDLLCPEGGGDQIRTSTSVHPLMLPYMSSAVLFSGFLTILFIPSEKGEGRSPTDFYLQAGNIKTILG
ncbi:hypothetical protein F4782DRAFT_477809, partial [Xylaria castorea]